MAEFPHMPMFWADYMVKTPHLSTEEHGAYLLILGTMWMNGGFLPDDDRKLARVARLSPGKWMRIAPTIREFLTVDNGRLTQKRIQETRENVLELSEKRSQAAKERWARKPLKNHDAGHANAYPNADAKDHAKLEHLNLNKGTSTVDSLTSFENQPSSAEAPAIDFRSELFRRGLDVVVSLTGKGPAQARTVVGRWLRDAHDEAVVVLEAIDAAAENRPADAVPWINQAILRRMEARGSRAPPKRVFQSV